MSLLRNINDRPAIVDMDVERSRGDGVSRIEAKRAETNVIARSEDRATISDSDDLRVIALSSHGRRDTVVIALSPRLVSYPLCSKGLTEIIEEKILSQTYCTFRKMQ
jgi:hypothetical protein